MVAPFLLPASHPLAGVNDVYNAVFVHGNMLGDAMFYGSGAGKLPTASAVVADVIDMTKHTNRNVCVAWDEAEIALVDYKNGSARFFVRTASDPETIETVFGVTEYVEGVVPGERGFLTETMTETEFEEKAAGITMIGRIRVA
jgi:homoserine dehydrogenase